MRIDGLYESYTLVLARRNHDKLGMLKNVSSIINKRNLNGANELSFTVYKYTDKEKYLEASKEDKYKYIEPLWNEITDFKYVWVKETDEYYEITVENNDTESEYKSVTGSSACEVELGQTNVYNLEINTEDDIARDDYKEPTVFYNPNNPKASLLHRAMYKVPHYSIKYVDKSLWNIQRTFSADSTDLYSFLTNDVAEEIGCLVTFDSSDRSISVYDLKTVCNDCGYRGEYSDVCPECGSINLQYYGDDTTVLIDDENIANSITCTTDTDSVKNCFRLEAGDDDMTAAVVNSNPNGSQYIYYFSEDQKHDMSPELVAKLESYDELYNQYKKPYAEIIKAVYNAIDKILYYTSSMMPHEEIVEHLPSSPVEGAFYLLKTTKDGIYNEYIWQDNVWIKLDQVERYEETSARIELNRIIKNIPSELNKTFLSVSQIRKTTSNATINSALKQYAKIFFQSGKYKIDTEGIFTYVGEETNVDGGGINYGVWEGSITLTNYADEEDTYKQSEIMFKVDDDYYNFLNNKVQKKLADNKNDEGSIYDVLSIKEMKPDGETEDVEATLEKFKYALRYYALNRLTSFSDALQGCIDVMIEENQGNESSDLYDTMYEPYHNKLIAVQEEIDKRNATIDAWEKSLESEQKRQKEVQDKLNFEKYIGEELYNEFLCFRREDTYKNDNYISDDLDNDTIFDNAQKFIKAAQDEIVKSGEHQHSITTDINNLFAIKEFAPIKNKFKLGNWIRVKIDGTVYRLRLIAYQIDFDSPESLEVEFSDVTKTASGVNDLQSILSKANSMATSYGSVINQVDKSAKQAGIVSGWIKNGLDLTNMDIVSSKDQNVVYGKNGLLIRSYSDIEEAYSDEQLKLINSTLAITNDNWKTTKTAVGKFRYIDPTTNQIKIGYGINAECLIGQLILGQQLRLYSENGYNTLTFDDNGLELIAKPVNGVYSEKIFSIKKQNEDGSLQNQIYVNNKGEVVINTEQFNIVAGDAAKASEALDLASKGISKIETEYYLSTSTSELIGGSWSTDSPTWRQGYYVWTRTKMYYKDNSAPTYSNPSCIAGAKGSDGSKGEKGDNGIGIKSVTPQYAKSTSNITAPTTGWSDTQPTVEEGYYIWTRSHIEWDDGTSGNTDPILSEIANGLAKAITSIKVNQDNIELKVSKTDYNGKTIASLINQTEDSIQIDANKINLNGYVTMTDLSTKGKTSIVGDNITTGLIKSKNYVANTSGSQLSLVDGTFDSKYLKWDKTGKIVSTSGSIGGWQLDSEKIYKKITETIDASQNAKTSYSIELYSSGYEDGNDNGGSMNILTKQETTADTWINSNNTNGYRLIQQAELTAGNIFTSYKTYSKTTGDVSSFELDLLEGMLYFSSKTATSSSDYTAQISLSPLQGGHFFIESSAYMGITAQNDLNIESTSGKIYIKGGDKDSMVYISRTGGKTYEPVTSWTYGHHMWLDWTGSSIICRVDATNFTLSHSSDKRLKKDIDELDEKLINTYMSLKPSSYVFKDDGAYHKDGREFGLIAQDIIQAFANNGLDFKDYTLVNVENTLDDKQRKFLNGDDHYYSVDYDNLHALHILVNKNQEKRIQYLEMEIEKLKKKLGE